MNKEEINRKLSKHLKKNKSILNILGEFKYVKQIGSGGTSIIYEVKLEEKSYAIKFLLSDISKQETVFKRFKQSYLNLASISHLGVSLPQIHMDSLSIDSELKVPYTIMPKASSTLKDLINTKKKESKFNKQFFEKIFKKLMEIIDAIHRKNIIHRDIKPENIFILNGTMLLGDFDIGKFDDCSHIKLVDTVSGDRLANYHFSAPEQSDKNIENITAEADWYAFGQVIYWMIKNKTLRGQENIRLEGYEEYEKLVSKLLSSNPQKRCKSRKDIENFMKRDKPLSKTTILNNFDEIIQKYTCEDSDMYVFKEYNDEATINEIMTDLSKEAPKLNLWWSQGYSDMGVDKISQIKEHDKCWLVEFDEIKIKSIWIYKHSPSFGRSIIIVEVDNFQPTGIYEDSNYKYEEYGVFDNKHFVTRTQFDAGYAIINETRTKLDFEKTEIRNRLLKQDIYFLAPQFGGPLVKNEKIIDSIYKQYNANKKINKELLSPLLNLKKGYNDDY